MLVGLRSMGVSAHSVTSSPSGTLNSSSGTCVTVTVCTGCGRGAAPGHPAARSAAEAAAAAARKPAAARPPTASGRASGSPARNCVGAWAGLYTAGPLGDSETNCPAAGRTRMRELSRAPMPDTPERSPTPRLVALGAMIGIAGMLAIAALVLAQPTPAGGIPPYPEATAAPAQPRRPRRSFPAAGITKLVLRAEDANKAMVETGARGSAIEALRDSHRRRGGLSLPRPEVARDASRRAGPRLRLGAARPAPGRLDEERDALHP